MINKQKQFWEKYLLTYDVLNEAIPYQNLLQDLIKALNVKNDELIFDAGSGTGNLCVKLKECGSKPIGFDFSEKALEIHLQKDQDATVHLGNLTKRLPFPDNYFDKVVSNNVLYTIDKNDRLNVINELYRVLNPNGKIVIANVHTGFNPFIIFMDHLRQVNKMQGIFRTASDMVRKSYTIGKMFYYSSLLIRKNIIKQYAFLEEYEQKNLLMQAGFRNIPKTMTTYANQSYMDMGEK
jgi:ubiquinone/menaquinone biosynthesis C-methylase UbiE